MKLAITGSSGLIGTALTKYLTGKGHHVTPVVRQEPAADQIGWRPDDGQIDGHQLVGFDAVIHLAGAGIGARRWNDKYKQVLLDSRVAGTTLLAHTLADLDNGPKVLISASAIGYYGNRGSEILDETSAPGNGFLSEVCQQWEAATAAASNAGIRVTHIRTGIVLAQDGGALAKMLPLFKLGLGGKFGSGNQYMSWISLNDTVRAIEFLLTADVSGPVNLTGPTPVTNDEFADTLGSVVSRPVWLPVPKFGPRLLLGREMADSLLFDSTRALPTMLRTSGFEFEQATVEAALAAAVS